MDLFKDYIIGKKNLILIIEDDPEPAYVLTEFLKLKGFKTRLAKDGAEGLEMAKKIDPALILLDIMLPKMDGFNVLLQIKSQPETKEIPVVMCSALNRIN